MDGFTAARSAIPFAGAPAAHERAVAGSADPHIVAALVGTPDVQGVADAAQRHLRRVCTQWAGDGAPVRGI